MVLPLQALLILLILPLQALLILLTLLMPARHAVRGAFAQSPRASAEARQSAQASLRILVAAWVGIGVHGIAIRGFDSIWLAIAGGGISFSVLAHAAAIAVIQRRHVALSASSHGA